MNDTVRNDPWRVVPRLQDEINRLFGNATESDSSSVTAAWIPAVDIYEYADRFELYVDVPGVEPNKVELTLEDGVLTLSGRRAEQAMPKNADAPQYRRSERHHGHFYRRFMLPDTVDSDNVNATGKNGVLKIAIPKQAKAKPRRIEISS
jgi:HSP20 family protein